MVPTPLFSIPGLNSVTLLGRAGSVAQKRGTPDSPVVIFSLATNSYHKNAEGKFQIMEV